MVTAAGGLQRTHVQTDAARLSEGHDAERRLGLGERHALDADARLAMLPRPHLRLSRPKPWGPTDRIGPARPPTHDARSVGAVKAYPSSVSVTVVRAVRSLADSTLLSY